MGREGKEGQKKLLIFPKPHGQGSVLPSGVTLFRMDASGKDGNVTLVYDGQALERTE